MLAAPFLWRGPRVARGGELADRQSLATYCDTNVAYATKEA